MTITEVDGVTLPATADRRLHVLWNYLAEKRQSRRFASRADFDPIDVPDLLQYLSLVEVRSDQPRFIYSVFGTKLVNMLKHELTGKAVGTGVKASEVASVLARYERVAERGIAIYHQAKLQEESNDFTEIERLMIPLSGDGDTVDRILSITVPKAK